MSDAEISLAFSLLGTEQFRSQNNAVVQSLNNVKKSYEGVKKQFQDARKFSMAAAMVTTAITGQGAGLIRNIAEAGAQIGAFSLISRVVSAIPGIGPVVGTALTVIASTFMGEVVSATMNKLSEFVTKIFDYLQPSAGLDIEKIMASGTNRMRMMREQVAMREQQIQAAGGSISFVWGRREMTRMRNELNAAKNALMITMLEVDAKAQAALDSIDYDRRR